MSKQGPCRRLARWRRPARSIPILNTTLDELTEETARQIIVTLAPGATNYPFAAVKALLMCHLDETQELLAKRQLAEEERAQQN
jgi:hypothetical protein